jgi:hypothetical protein
VVDIDLLPFKSPASGLAPGAENPSIVPPVVV